MFIKIYYCLQNQKVLGPFSGTLKSPHNLGEINHNRRPNKDL